MSAPRSLSRLAAVLACLAAGCTSGGPDRTMIVVEVDSNLRVPDEIDKIELRAAYGDKEVQRLPFALAGGKYALPIRVGFLPHEAHADEELEIAAVALRADGAGDVTRERAIVTFLRNESLLLRLYLARECVAASCEAQGKTCTRGGACVDVKRRAASLPKFVPDDVPLRDGAIADVARPPDVAPAADASRDLADAPRSASDADAPPAVPDAGPERPRPDAAVDISDPVAADAPPDAPEDVQVPDAPLEGPAETPPDAPSDVPDDAPAPPLRANGSPCLTGGQCLSAVCSDGVCCAAGCAGPCESCALPGLAGTCAVVPAGTDPDGECPDDGAQGCVRDGTCSGARACRLYIAGTICASQTCAGSTETSARTCDGAGTCRPATTRICDPYLCAGGACAVTCNDSTQCIATSTCSGGQCLGPRPLGASCAQGAECGSMICVDGVCCAAACTGLCQACNLAGFLGTCAPIASGQDPANECPTDLEGTCARDGFCDGVGACRKWAGGTTCAGPTCAVGTQTAMRTCDGNGTCQSGATTACAPFACNASATACNTTCTTSGDCAPGAACAGGTCKLADGQTCSSGGQCASNNCVDGVCCNLACGGTCEACNVAGAAGTCTAIADGTDPANECAASAASTCGLDGSCSGNRTCRKWSSATQCAAQVCTGSTLTAARNCDGNGTCTAGTPSPCPNNYACNAGGTACRTSCTVAGDCASGYSCPVPPACSAAVTVAYVGTVFVGGIGSSSGAVPTDNPVTGAANTLYLAVVTLKGSDLSSTIVTGVNGLSLTWTRIASEQSPRNLPTIRTYVYKATTGNSPPADETVKAIISGTIDSAVIQVHRFVNANPTSPITQYATAYNDFGTPLTPSVTLSSVAANSMVLGAFGDSMIVLTAGAGYTARGQNQAGSGMGNISSNFVETKSIATPANNVVVDAVGMPTNWCAIAVEIASAP